MSHFGIIGKYGVHPTKDGHHLIVEYESDEVAMMVYFSREESVELSKALLEFISTPVSEGHEQ